MRRAKQAKQRANRSDCFITGGLKRGFPCNTTHATYARKYAAANATNADDERKFRQKVPCAINARNARKYAAHARKKYASHYATVTAVASDATTKTRR